MHQTTKVSIDWSMTNKTAIQRIITLLLIHPTIPENMGGRRKNDPRHRYCNFKQLKQIQKALKVLHKIPIALDDIIS